jgi:hypothetical protein
VLPNHKVCNKCHDQLRNPKPSDNAPKQFVLGAKPAGENPRDSSLLDKQLEHMMEEQQFPPHVRERTRALDIGTKWQLIRSWEQSLTLEKNEKNQPGYWVEKLQNPNSQIWKEPAKMQRFVNTIKSQSKTWCIQLLRDKGLVALLEGFHQTKNDEVKIFSLKAINAIISTRAGLEEFLKLPAAIPPLILYSLSAPNDCRFEIFEFLATAVGFSIEDGLPVVLEAMISPQCGRTPFKPFVEMLMAQSTSHGVRFKLLVLINALVNSADLLEDRQRTRQLLRSADFGKAFQWLRGEVNNHRAAIDGAAPVLAQKPNTNVLSSPSINRMTSRGSMDSMTSPQVANAAHIPLEEARANRSSVAQTNVLNAPGTNANRIIDFSEIWEMIRVQIELYEHAEEDDALDATRAGVDFGNIDQLLEYVRVHMSPHVGQYLLPLLQMICVLPLDTQSGQTLWSAVLTVVKRVIGASQANEQLSLEQLFSLTEKYAQNATMSVSDALVREKTNLEQQLNVLRDRVRELESRPPAAAAVPEGTAPAPGAGKELQQAKAEMLDLRTQLSRANKEIEALKAAGPSAAAPTTAVAVPAGEQSEALAKAMAQIASLELEILQLKSAGPSAAGGAGGAGGAAVATGPTTITINTPAPPCLPGFTPVPHEPRTVVIPAGQPIPGGAAAPGVAPSGTIPAAAPAAPASAIPSAPVLTGFTPVAGSAPAAGAAPAASAAPSSNAQPDGKPWPPVLTGFTAQPGNPNGAGAAPGAAPAAGGGASAAGPVVPAAPVEPPVKLPYTRRPIKPAAKMRQVHWAKLEEKVIESTIWFKLNDQQNIKLNSKELESMFCQAAPKSAAAPDAAASPGGTKAPTAKAQQVTFVEGQRGQNMAIAVSRFRPLTFEQIRDAILQMDTKTLSLETAMNMAKWLPTPEEVEMVSTYEGPLADLAQTDKFIMIVGRISALDRRLDAFIFKQQYQQMFDELSVKLQQCSQVLSNIHSSKSLLRVLEYVLAMGNYLNGGTKKGDAFGFEISYLTQLANTRSCDNKTNLLQYMIPIFDQDTQTAQLQDAFVGIEEVARLDIQQLTTDVSKFNAAVNKISGLIKQLTAKPAAGDKFVDVMTPFAAECEPKVKKLQDLLQKVLNVAKEMASSYGEDASKFGPTQIFGLFNDFNKQINQTRAEMKRQQELKAKQEKTAAAAAQRAAAGGAAGGTGGGAPTPGPRPPIGGPAGNNGLQGPDGNNALMAAFAQRRDKPPVPPKKEPTAEDEVASQVQGTLTGSDAGSVLAAIKARREERNQTNTSTTKRNSIFGDKK